MILIAVDKFKGSLTADEAAAAIADGLFAAGIREEVTICPMADGGEGTPDTVFGYPVIRSCDHIGWDNAGLVRKSILDRSSYALGEYLMHEYGPERQTGGTAAPAINESSPGWIAIGGTITSDGGAGMLQALGMRFYDAEGREIATHITPRKLADVSKVEMSEEEREYWLKRLRALSDVEASLTGPGLCALDFAAQKGATPEDIETIRRGLKWFASLAASGKSSPIDGAGGGIGFAIASVLGCPYSNGAETILESKNIEWREFSLVITGEGRIDRQTGGGKVVDAVRRAAESHGVRCVAVGGYVIPELRSRNVFTTISNPSEYNSSLAAQRLSRCIAANIKPYISKLQ